MKELFRLLFISLIFCLSTKSFASQNTVLISTNVGNIFVEIYNESPTVFKGFIDIIEKGIYDKTTIHSVKANQWISGGDQKTKIVKNNNYVFDNYFSVLSSHFSNFPRTHKAGSFSLIRDYGGGEFTLAFMINLKDEPTYDNRYQIIGEVVKGLDVAKNISSFKTLKGSEKPVDEVIINFVRRSPLPEAQTMSVGETVSNMSKGPKSVVEFFGTYPMATMVAFLLALIHIIIYYIRFLRTHQHHVWSLMISIFWIFFFFVSLANNEVPFIRGMSFFLTFIFFFIINQAFEFSNDD